MGCVDNIKARITNNTSQFTLVDDNEISRQVLLNRSFLYQSNCCRNSLNFSIGGANETFSYPDGNLELIKLNLTRRCYGLPIYINNDDDVGDDGFSNFYIDYNNTPYVVISKISNNQLYLIKQSDYVSIPEAAADDFFTKYSLVDINTKEISSDIGLNKYVNTLILFNIVSDTISLYLINIKKKCCCSLNISPQLISVIDDNDDNVTVN